MWIIKWMPALQRQGDLSSLSNEVLPDKVQFEFQFTATFATAFVTPSLAAYLHLVLVVPTIIVARTAVTRTAVTRTAIARTTVTRTAIARTTVMFETVMLTTTTGATAPTTLNTTKTRNIDLFQVFVGQINKLDELL